MSNVQAPGRKAGLSDHRPNGSVPSHLEPLLEVLRAHLDIALYYSALLAPLRRYDEEYHGDVVKTLDAYLRHGGNSTQTADALYVHRNSIRYRLARVRALTNLDLDDADTRLALQIALLLEL